MNPEASPFHQANQPMADSYAGQAPVYHDKQTVASGGEASQLGIYTAKSFDAEPAAIVSGLIALVVRLYSDASATEIVTTEPEFVEAIGLSQHLSPTRANGLASMLQRLKAEAANLIAKA